MRERADVARRKDVGNARLQTVIDHDAARHGLKHVNVLLPQNSTHFFDRLNLALQRSLQMQDKRVFMHQSINQSIDPSRSRRRCSCRAQLAQSFPDLACDSAEVKTQDDEHMSYRAAVDALRRDDVVGICNSGYGSAGIEGALRKFGAVWSRMRRRSGPWSSAYFVR